MIEIVKRHQDSHHGQHDFILVALLDGNPVGYLEFTEFERIPSVSTIEVHKLARRKGVGTSLILRLQEEYPETPISFGYTTDEGSLLLGSIEWDTRVNEAYDAALSRMTDINIRLGVYAERAETLSSATQAERDVFISQVSDWNELQDEADQLEEFLATTPRIYKFAIASVDARTLPVGVAPAATLFCP